MCSLKVRTCCIWCSSPGAGRCKQMGAELKRSSAVRSALKEAGKQHHWLFSERCGDISAQNTPGCESWRGATSCPFIPCLRGKKKHWKILRTLCQNILLEMKGFFMNVALGLKFAFSALNFSCFQLHCFQCRFLWKLELFSKKSALNFVLCHGLQSSLPYTIPANSELCRAPGQLILDSDPDEGCLFIKVKGGAQMKWPWWLSCTAVASEWEKLLSAPSAGKLFLS